MMPGVALSPLSCQINVQLTGWWGILIFQQSGTKQDVTPLGRSRAAGEDEQEEEEGRAEWTTGQWWRGWRSELSGCPGGKGWKRQGLYDLGWDGRDERDRDNTSCNIDEESKGTVRAAVEATASAWWHTWPVWQGNGCRWYRAPSDSLRGRKKKQLSKYPGWLFTSNYIAGITQVHKLLILAF